MKNNKIALLPGLSLFLCFCLLTGMGRLAGRLGGGAPLTERLKFINYCGACVVAAHQDIVRSGMQGYVDSRGKADIDKRDEYVKHGDRVIKSIIL